MAWNKTTKPSAFESPRWSNITDLWSEVDETWSGYLISVFSKVSDISTSYSKVTKPSTAYNKVLKP